MVANAVRRALPTATVNVQVVNHSSKTLLGSLVARTDTGCVFHHSALHTANKANWEQIGSKLARGLTRQINLDACVDEHMQDQLVVFMAMANGVSRVKIGKMEGHTEAAIYVL